MHSISLPPWSTPLLAFPGLLLLRFPLGDPPEAQNCAAAAFPWLTPLGDPPRSAAAAFPRSIAAAFPWVTPPGHEASAAEGGRPPHHPIPAVAAAFPWVTLK